MFGESKISEAKFGILAIWWQNRFRDGGDLNSLIKLY